MKLFATLIFTFILAIQTVDAQDIEIGALNMTKIYVKVDPEKGKYFSHIVQAKETLYGLSRKYNTSVDAIYELNFSRPGLIIQPGTELFIPFNDQYLVDQKPNNATYVPIFYQVQAQENIYRISKVYFNQEIALMKSRNNLESLNLSIDQELQIGWFPISGIQSNKTIKDKSDESTIVETHEEILVDSIHHQLPIIDTVEVAKKNELFVEKDTLEKVKIFRSQMGIAMWNKNSADKENLYAMHRTAKVNSLIEIYNPLLKRKAFAKVIGHISPGLYPDDISLIVTPRVAQSLGMKDKRFRVEMKFYE